MKQKKKKEEKLQFAKKTCHKFKDKTKSHSNVLILALENEFSEIIYILIWREAKYFLNNIRYQICRNICSKHFEKSVDK